MAAAFKTPRDNGPHRRQGGYSSHTHGLERRQRSGDLAINKHRGDGVARRTRVIAPDDPGYRAQQEYTSTFLTVYDALVLGLFGRALWRVRASDTVSDYERHARRRHLEVGPGTGYFLDKARLPSDVEITLADPNPEVLAYAARRLARYGPATVELDVRKPLPVEGPFDSVGMNYLLHCLPGPLEEKEPAIRSVASVVAEDGVLFGGTIVTDSPAHTWASRALLRSNNRRGIFGNAGDTVPGLRELLQANFRDVHVALRGTVAVFTAAGPR